VARPVHRILVIAALCLALAFAAGCGGSSGSSSALPDQAPGLFVSSVVRQKATGQYELAWRSLHPLHQKVAPEKVYVHCENLTVFPGHLIKISIVGVKDEPVLIAGEKDTVPSKAVTFKVYVNSPGIPKPVVVKETYHTIPVDGHWTWILTKDSFSQYKAGICPGTNSSTKA